MRCALLGDHPDGLDLTRALIASGRHELVTYSGPAVGAESLRRWGITPDRVSDLEELLADPQVEAVIVAGRLADRPGQLRRALQSERHVLCVHPADRTPDVAYEAAMIREDTHCLLLPLLPEAQHPAVAQLADLVNAADSPLGDFRVLQIERSARDAVLLEAEEANDKPAFPSWDVLRKLRGEIAEVSAFAARDAMVLDEPLLLAGRFERGGLFQALLLPGESETRWCLTAIGTAGRAELLFPLGWPGPAVLRWRDATGEQRTDTWEPWDPWPPLLQTIEAALGQEPAVPRAEAELLGQNDSPSEAVQTPATLRTVSASLRASAALRGTLTPPTWQDAIRGLELDDAARRSVERRRASPLEYPEASEEVGFKGTMTLVGCGLLWGALVLLLLSAWVPWVGWVIAPLFLLFLALQLLRWIVFKKKPQG